MAKVENQGGKGLFNFQQIMESFYGGKAESEDQQLQKDTYAGNMVQSALDAQLAQNLAQNNRVCFFLENRMACGMGMCYGCVLKVNNEFIRICREGPVVNAADIAYEDIA